jgi:hypothetical protein
VVKLVMPGLVPGMTPLPGLNKKDVDGRDKPGHDDKENRFQLIGELEDVACILGQALRS